MFSYGLKTRLQVAIPFSSGLCSFRPLPLLRPQGVAIPFSSGLCSFGRPCPVCLSDDCRNPFFIRSVFVRRCLSEPTTTVRPMSQSLFHQVCVRSPRQGQLAGPPGGRNPFFIRSVFVPKTVVRINAVIDRSQSLFHQVCVRSPPRCGLCAAPSYHVAIPFSSGLCSFNQNVEKQVQPKQGRNPFFIRSVFVQKR